MLGKVDLGLHTDPNVCTLPHTTKHHHGITMISSWHHHDIIVCYAMHVVILHCRGGLNKRQYKWTDVFVVCKFK